MSWFGLAVRRAREAAGLTQKALAARMGYVHQVQISRIERGQSKLDEALAEIRRLESALDLPAGWLLDDLVGHPGTTLDYIERDKTISETSRRILVANYKVAQEDFAEREGRAAHNGTP